MRVLNCNVVLQPCLFAEQGYLGPAPLAHDHRHRFSFGSSPLIPRFLSSKVALNWSLSAHHSYFRTARLARPSWLVSSCSALIVHILSGYATLNLCVHPPGWFPACSLGVPPAAPLFSCSSLMARILSCNVALILCFFACHGYLWPTRSVGRYRHGFSAAAHCLCKFYLARWRSTCVCSPISCFRPARSEHVHHHRFQCSALIVSGSLR